jgi:hypothetical protein
MTAVAASGFASLPVRASSLNRCSKPMGGLHAVLPAEICSRLASERSKGAFEFAALAGETADAPRSLREMTICAPKRLST